ncbi:hypothetical protein DPMN_094699 [Dreissena polymorpha]|uniref:Uncharacterized protein n=1 Tax=Dreissena polymorpha TaxID=45954 RepID=A0A9D4L6L6_DREPO|nr:hypothetical protein DPMN_094699 [Dreissena polymorpha]
MTIHHPPGTSEYWSPMTDNWKSHPAACSCNIAWKNDSGFLSCSLKIVTRNTY